MSAAEELTPDRSELYARVKKAADEAFGPMPSFPDTTTADGEYQVSREQQRRLAQSDAVIHHVTGCADLRPRDLTDTQLEQCIQVCEQIAAGTHEAHLRSNGRYTIRPVVGSRREATA